MEVNAIFVFSDDAKKRDIRWRGAVVASLIGPGIRSQKAPLARRFFFSAAPLTKNIPRRPRVSLLPSEIYNRHRESRGLRNNSIVVDARWASGASTLRSDSRHAARKKINSALSILCMW